MQPAAKGDLAIETPAQPDSFTVGAIAILAYMLGNVLHEGLGHGGACVLVGGKPLVMSSVHFECSLDHRLVDAGGTLVNLVAGAVFLCLGRLASRSHPRWKYFFWISMTVNLYTGTGYFLFSGIGGIGDWAAFIQGLGPQWIGRTGLAIVGAATYLLAACVSLLELRPLIGSSKEQRYKRAVRMTLIPYFVGGILMCIAGAFNPQGMILILVSAAASAFGGTSGLIWSPYLLRGALIPYGPPTEPPPISKSWSWFVASAIITVAFILVLGPGIQFVHT
jgi:hypothetical protein